MPTRKPRNPELAKAVDNLGAAGRHLRNAVQGKVEALRGVAADEIARAKAALLKRTNLAQDRVEAVLKKTEDRLHKAIVGAQKALDRAVAQAEKRSKAAAPAPAKKAVPARKRAGTGARKTATARKASAEKA